MVSEQAAEIERLKVLLSDECEKDTELRAIASRVLSDLEANGDSYGVPTIVDVAESLVQEVERLRAEVEELKRDKERLDWLFVFDPPYFVWVKEKQSDWPRGFVKFSREAIDAARK